MRERVPRVGLPTKNGLLSTETARREKSILFRGFVPFLFGHGVVQRNTPSGNETSDLSMEFSRRAIVYDPQKMPIQHPAGEKKGRKEGQSNGGSWMVWEKNKQQSILPELCMHRVLRPVGRALTGFTANCCEFPPCTAIERERKLKLKGRITN